MGLVALAMGIWVVAYVAAHEALDAGSRELALGTAGVCFAFALYVLLRRVRRGPQH
jgi:hypothetical protein